MRKFIVIIRLVVVAFLLLSCSVFSRVEEALPTYTPPPTYTPQPTYTPYPTEALTVDTQPSYTIEPENNIEVFYENDFSDVENSLKIVSSDRYETTQEDGVYKIEHSADSPIYIAIPVTAYDFILDVDISVQSGPEDGATFGLGFRGQEGFDHGYYRWRISTNGNFHMHANINNETLPLEWFERDYDIAGDWFSSSAIEQGFGVFNHLRVVANGEQLTFYINDQMVMKARDNRLQNSQFALITYADGYSETIIDNLKITELDDKVLSDLGVIQEGGTIASSSDTIDSDMVIINTNDPNYGVVISHKNGEALILSTENGTDGNIANVTGATWISPDGASITVYFEGGLPTHAVISESYVIFEYNNDNSANITIIAPDGSKSNQPNVPIDIQPIPNLDQNSNQSKGTPHLASFTNQNYEMTTKDWAREVSIALGLFSCSVSIGSGGSLSILTGAGCAATIYTIWSTSQAEESPVLDAGATGISGFACGFGIARKDPISVADCASGLIDLGSRIFLQADTVVSRNEGNSPQDQILGMWIGEAIWSCDPPSWIARFDFSLNSVLATFTRDGETHSANGTWSLTGNNIVIQFPTNTYPGVVSGDSMEGTMLGAGEGCDGAWSATRE